MRPVPMLAVLLALLAPIALPAIAEDDRRVLRIGEVSGDALAAGEATALRGLISSYVIERGGFRVVDSEGRPLSPDESATAPLTADYVLAAKASRIAGRIALSIDLTKIATGEKKSVADVFVDLNDLVLSSRRLTVALLDRAFGPPAAAQAASSPPRTASQNPADFDIRPELSAVAGTWDGDKGIDSVSLRPDGRGFALLDSGVRMLVKATISGSFVIVSQDQPNSPDFYRPDLDPKSARIVSAAARRWKWIFSLSSDGSLMKGFKESVFVKVDEKGSVSVDNDYSREALWTRRSR